MERYLAAKLRLFRELLSDGGSAVAGVDDPEFTSIEAFMAQWSDQVVFEITEVAGIRNYDRVIQVIKQLRASGFQIALDDLGSGYAGSHS